MRFCTRYILYAALISCFFIAACENDVKKIDALLTNKTAVEEAFKIETYLSQSGLIKARLTAPYMLRYQSDSPYVEFPRTFHVDFFSDSTKIESTVDALYAKFREFERKVFLKDSVLVINILSRDTLRTSELWWDQEKQEIYTDKPVRIYQPDKTIFGKFGLRATQNLSKYDIFNTSGQVLVPPSGLPE